MTPVGQSTVVRYWLRAELAKPVATRRPSPRRPPPTVGELSDREALDALLDRKPGAAGFLAAAGRTVWHETTLTPARFRSLRLIDAPRGLGWRSLAPDRCPFTAARRILDADPDGLAAVDADVDHVRRLREELGDAAAPPLVVRTRRGRTPWVVVDGNHRAVARAIRVLEAERAGEPVAGLAPQAVYVGERPNPVVRPLVERLRGGLSRLLGREPAPG
jgi:hypothetical protein